MSLPERLYRVTKRAVNALPPTLLRGRAYGVYSVALPTTQLPAFAVDDQQGTWSFRWLTTADECRAITGMVDSENLRSWNGTTRRAAVAWRKGADSVDEQPLGVAWIALDTFDEQQLGLRVELEPQQAWLHSAFVAHAWRNRHVYRALLRFVLHSLGEESFEQLLLGVSVGNEPSLHSHRAVGATSVGSIFAIRSLGVSFCTTKGQVRCPNSVGRCLNLSVIS